MLQKVQALLSLLTFLSHQLPGFLNQCMSLVLNMSHFSAVLLHGLTVDWCHGHGKQLIVLLSTKCHFPWHLVSDYSFRSTALVPLDLQTLAQLARCTVFNLQDKVLSYMGNLV